MEKLFEKKKRWCVEECELFIKQLLAAIAHCEKNGVVHGDITGMCTLCCRNILNMTGSVVHFTKIILYYYLLLFI